MGFFSKKKVTNSGIVDWLNCADNALALAFQTKSIAGLESYFDANCGRKMLARIRANEKEYAGIDRYKHVEWSKSSSTGDKVLYKKSVSYDHVKLSHGVIAPVGQDYMEEWTLTNEDSPKVIDIRRLTA